VLSDVQCSYGRVLDIAWAGAFKDRLVFSGEDDCCYTATLAGNVHDVSGAALENLDSQRYKRRPSKNRMLVGRHESYVSGVAVQGEFVVTAGWDGHLCIRTVPGLNELGDVNCAPVGESVDVQLIFKAAIGNTVYRVEWIGSRDLYLSTRESTGRCAVHRIDIAEYDDDDDDDEAYEVPSGQRT
jgi:hypothetical protein